MFFQQKITLPKRDWKVLEIGPGALPHPRSDAFLELEYRDELTKIRQRGDVTRPPDLGTRPVYFYGGSRFPFSDNEFDYVICSHVIEHVLNPEAFMKEIFRVGSGRGYLEYPLVPYEYLFNFDVHLNVLKYSSKQRTLFYARKSDILGCGSPQVCKLFRSALASGWSEMIECNKEVFFEGVEFNEPISISHQSDVSRYFEEGTKFKEKIM
jgi:SAM-dependent methyltransferase